MHAQNLRLIYVFDPLCGWCYGFSATMQAFHDNHPTLPLEVISGGLFTDRRVAPLGDYPFIAQANIQISQRSGAIFGAAFNALLEQGDVLLDSETAAAGFAALRSQAPERALELASAVQRAFFMDGRDLNDPYTYQDLARAYKLDARAAGKLLADLAWVTSTAQGDFTRARRLGAMSFPTLLLDTGQHSELLARGLTPLDRLEAAFERLSQA